METILVVDDDIWIRNMFRQMLEREGYTVLAAENGMDGTDLCRKQIPDLVITYINMPGPNGFDTIGCLRHEFPDLRVLAISGVIPWKADFNLEPTHSPVAECILSQPVKKDTLLSAVRELLNPCCYSSCQQI